MPNIMHTTQYIVLSTLSCLKFIIKVVDLNYKLLSTVQTSKNATVHILRMPDEYFIHVICLVILPTETVWSMYGINNIRK